jgi:hypothetical protein
MRKHRKAFGHHDARRAIDLVNAHRLHRVLEHALVAEPVDQRDGRQQAGRQQRQQGDAAEQRLEAHAAALQRIGKAEGQRDDDDRDQRRHPQAVGQRIQQRRCARIGDEVGQADEAAAGVFQRLHQDGASGAARKASSSSSTTASMGRVRQPRRSPVGSSPVAAGLGAMRTAAFGPPVVRRTPAAARAAASVAGCCPRPAPAPTGSSATAPPDAWSPSASACTVTRQ